MKGFANQPIAGWMSSGRVGVSAVDAVAGVPAAWLGRDLMVFLVVSTLDVLMTYILLTHQDGMFFESNPLAQYCLAQWGFGGMILYKYLLVGVVAINAAIISRMRREVAQRLIQSATVLVNAVVLYSLFLLLRHG